MELHNDKLIQAYISAEKLIKDTIKDIYSKKNKELISPIIDNLKYIYNEWSDLSIPYNYIDWANRQKKDDRLWKTLFGIWLLSIIQATKKVNNLMIQTLSQDDIIYINRKKIDARWYNNLALNRMLESVWVYGWTAKKQINGILSWSGSQQSKNTKIQDILQKKWLTKIQYKNWSKYNISDYVKMLVNSETHQAKVIWWINYWISIWVKEFVRVENITACPICTPHIWEIWKVWDKPPVLTYHPYCRWYWDILK